MQGLTTRIKKLSSELMDDYATEIVIKTNDKVLARKKSAKKAKKLIRIVVKL